MPGTHRGHTTPHGCATINNPNRSQPSHRDQQARHQLQEKASDFHAQFHDPISVSYTHLTLPTNREV